MLFFSPIHVLFSASFTGGKGGSLLFLVEDRGRGEIDCPISFLYGVDLSDFWSVLVLYRVRRGGRGFKLWNWEGRKEGREGGWMGGWVGVGKAGNREVGGGGGGIGDMVGPSDWGVG
jgi:hypothetical protein